MIIREDIPEGLRNCTNCNETEHWQRTEDRLHFVIPKSCQMCLMGTLSKSVPFPLKGWLPQYKAGIYVWLKQADGAVCPKDGTPIRYGRHTETCDGCNYTGKMSYVSGDDMLTIRCHYVLARNCSNCKELELMPISSVCSKCIGHHFWKDPRPPPPIEMTP